MNEILKQVNIFVTFGKSNQFELEATIPDKIFGEI